jgi:hypothetical protein
MKRRGFLENWGLTNLKINLGFLEGEFAKLAIRVLNQISRPFTAKWHRLSLPGGFKKPPRCREFRVELIALQTQVRNYTKALAAMAQVEDLTTLETAESRYTPP